MGEFIYTEHPEDVPYDCTIQLYNKNNRSATANTIAVADLFLLSIQFYLLSLISYLVKIYNRHEVPLTSSLFTITSYLRTQ